MREQGPAHTLQAFCLARVHTMGSFGPNHWFKCYWCEWWQQSDVYIIDWIGHPLCDRCFDWHVHHQSGPYLPSSIDRAENHLTVVLFRHVAEFPSILIRRVAEFLREWHEP